MVDFRAPGLVVTTAGNAYLRQHGRDVAPGIVIAVDCHGRTVQGGRGGSQDLPSRARALIVPGILSLSSPQRFGDGHMPRMSFGDDQWFPLPGNAGRTGYAALGVSPPQTPLRLAQPMQDTSTLLGTGERSDNVTSGNGTPNLTNVTVDHQAKTFNIAGRSYTVVSASGNEGGGVMPAVPTGLGAINNDDTAQVSGFSGFQINSEHQRYGGDAINAGVSLNITGGGENYRVHYQGHYAQPISLITGLGADPVTYDAGFTDNPIVFGYVLTATATDEDHVTHEWTVPHEGLALVITHWRDKDGRQHSLPWLTGPVPPAIREFFDDDLQYVNYGYVTGGLDGGVFPLGAPLNDWQPDNFGPLTADGVPYSDTTSRRYGLPPTVAHGPVATPHEDGDADMVRSPVRDGKHFVIGRNAESGRIGVSGYIFGLHVEVNGADVGSTYTHYAALSAANDGPMTLLLWDGAQLTIFPGLGPPLRYTLREFLDSIGFAPPEGYNPEFFGMSSQHLHYAWPLQRAGLNVAVKDPQNLSSTLTLLALRAWDAWQDATPAQWRASGQNRPRTRAAYDRLPPSRRPPGPLHGLTLGDQMDGYRTMRTGNYDENGNEIPLPYNWRDQVNVMCPPELPAPIGESPYCLPAQVMQDGKNLTAAVDLLGRSPGLDGLPEQIDDKKALGAGTYTISFRPERWRPQWVVCLMGRMQGDLDGLTVNGEPLAVEPLGPFVEARTDPATQATAVAVPRGFVPFSATLYLDGNTPEPPVLTITLATGAKLSQLALVPAFPLDDHPED